MEQTPKLKNQTEQIVESFDDAIKKLNEIKERVAKNPESSFHANQTAMLIANIQAVLKVYQGF